MLTCLMSPLHLTAVLPGTLRVHFPCHLLICARRILQVSNHLDVVKITSPPGGIVNITAADPKKFKVMKDYVFSTEHNAFIVASLTGVTTYFSNVPGFREVCVLPFLHSWPRFGAVLGRIFRTDKLYFRTWNNGVVFGAGMWKGCGLKVFPSSNSKGHAPIAGAILSRETDSQSFPSFTMVRRLTIGLSPGV